VSSFFVDPNVGYAPEKFELASAEWRTTFVYMTAMRLYQLAVLERVTVLARVLVSV
jgi:hypothetical protein